ncbi:hypothetical protein B0T10DRAFT_587666 [Thelonectria olida]|uniref:non-specific serine/threonine protein kinase n=1 Tax=Thelonectria olida TaxID=1576542 RepID=A0A9P8WDR1_9HYPO|nr:hypothetical protein B0T10DRAFT_587666 [Thelonectria olida]
MRRPPGEGRQPSHQQMLLLAFAFILVPWIQLVDAQQQHRPAQVPLQQIQYPRDSSQQQANDGAAHHWAATRANVADGSRETLQEAKRAAVFNRQPYQQKPLERRKATPNRKNRKNERENHPNINDARALATLAPAQSVRAPPPSRHQWSSSIPASGLSSPHNARSLEDWEVEDFVLLATVDGDLYANDRRTGKERWHLEVDQPMVETKHHRFNHSTLDDDYDPIDHYIWAVEPSRDGAIYVWIPDSNSSLVWTGFTMKKIVEELAPHKHDKPPVVYTGDKKTTMITLDAATGRVLKWFGSGGSHVNQAESCLRPDTLYDMDNEECSSTGTITLGRTEYTVGIQRADTTPIATLKYTEWSPNNFDNDLWQQHQSSLDSRYITSQHDGKVYAFDYARSEKAEPLFSEDFSTPVARVFDVCRPWDATLESNPDLVVLPQPAMPSQDETIARMRTNSIFLNQTRTGSWYAMSGRSYPLIIHAPIAQISRPDWWEIAPAWDTINQDKLSKALVGTHFLETFRGGERKAPTLPSAPSDSYEDFYPYDEDENESHIPNGAIEVSSDEPTIIKKVKLLLQSAADSVIEFVSNPILVILLFTSLIYNESKLRRSYHRLRRRGILNLIRRYFIAKPDPELIEDEPVEDEQDDLLEPMVSTPEAEDKEDALPTPQTSEKSLVVERKTPPTPVKKDVAINEAEPTQLGKGLADAATAALGVVQDGAQATPPPEKKKKAHRGRRGGVRHRKRATEASQSRGDERTQTVDEAVDDAKKLGGHNTLEPDIMTGPIDMSTVTGSIIRMGNIEVNTDEQLGTGSNGTLVFAGKFDGRDVAVKRMLIQFYDIASQETRLLRESDDHPNVIRYYSQQMREGFLYIALERCAASLADVVEKPHFFSDLAQAGRQDLPNVLYQITNGINHLHGLRIVHRDLKPQNILINMGKDGKPRLLVSDFGLCKKLEGGQSSFGATTGRAAGTTGWRAPELLLDDDARESGQMEVRQMEFSNQSGSNSILVGDNMPHNRRATRAIDIFSLGLVFFYVLTNGSHPFDCGDRYMREVNIRKGNYNLRPLDALGDFAYEAQDLISMMLHADPKKRPSAKDVMSHPFFWSAKKRLAFLCDVSDHFEKEPRDPPSPALAELESYAPEITRGDFLRALPRDFVDSLGKQRKYTGTRLLDLLRALRNKKNHYEDMPDSLKRSVGPLPEGYLGFWTVKFPQLLLACWNVVYNVQWDETDRFREYYEPAAL